MATAVWVPVEDLDTWVLATVKDKTDTNVELQRYWTPPEGVSQTLSMTPAEFDKLRLCTMDYTDIAEDLTMLEEVNEASILHTLRQRYNKDLIFTAIGPVLIAVNPYRPVSCCDSDYMLGLKKEDPATLSPHVFKVANTAITGLIESRRAQSILISGESGAGKTETNKLCLVCLAEISGSSGRATDAALDSAILLEAFGNAATVYNDNSSRFGKWCAVNFDADYKVGRCVVEVYLLEQTR
eukprot:5534936-Prymnesium_polylepis.1